MSTGTANSSGLSETFATAARRELRALQVTASLLIPAVIFLPLSRFPSICIFLFITGLPCPGCGFTRALKQNFAGNFLTALSLHPFALPGALWISLLVLSIFIKPLANFYVQNIRLVHRLYLVGTLAMLAFGLVRLGTILSFGAAPWIAPEILAPR